MLRVVAFAAAPAHDPALFAKGEELKTELLAHPDVEPGSDRCGAS